MFLSYNGEIFFTKGYGYADVAARKKVDHETTLFQIGSNAKLFTWTAVMQLVEQGKIDLNADVNTYLTDWKVPATFPEPITMAHLMSHSAGLEDSIVGIFARSEEALIPIVPLLEQKFPARVMPPGELSAYSNLGAGLAAYIVQEVTGMPWHDYIRKNILEPLEMHHTTLVEN